MVFALINTIFAQETTKVAHAQWRVVSDQLREKFPRLAELREGAEQEVLSFMDFHKEHRVKIHSTNVLERLNDGEIKRRASLSGFLCLRHSMSNRSMYANEQDEVEERGDRGQVGGAAQDPEGTA
jgi:transposase-like protein